MKHIVLSFLGFLYIAHPGLLSANSSFDDLIEEVAEETGISKSLSLSVITKTFEKITTRMLEDKGTSVPDFGRFYVQEKQKASEVDKDGFTLAPRMIRVPRCTMSKELREILEK